MQKSNLLGSMQKDLENTPSSQGSPQNHVAVQYYLEKTDTGLKDLSGGADRHTKRPSSTDSQTPTRDITLGPIRRHYSHRGDSVRDFLKPFGGHGSRVDKNYRIRGHGSNDERLSSMSSKLSNPGKRGKEVRFLPSEGGHSSDHTTGPYARRFDGCNSEQVPKKERKTGLYHEKLDARGKEATNNNGNDNEIEDRKHPGFERLMMGKRPIDDNEIQNTKRAKRNPQASFIAKHTGYDTQRTKEGNTSHLQRSTERGNIEGMESKKPIVYQKLNDGNKLHIAEIPETPSHTLSIRLAASISSSKDGFHVRLSEELSKLRDLGNLGLETFTEKTKAYRDHLEEEKPKAFPLCAQESKVFQSFGKSEADIHRVRTEMAASWHELESIDRDILELANRINADMHSLDHTWLDTAQSALDTNGKDWIKQMAVVEKRIAATELRDKMRIYKTPW